MRWTGDDAPGGAADRGVGNWLIMGQFHCTIEIRGDEMVSRRSTCQSGIIRRLPCPWERAAEGNWTKQARGDWKEEQLEEAGTDGMVAPRNQSCCYYVVLALPQASGSGEGETNGAVVCQVRCAKEPVLALHSLHRPGGGGGTPITQVAV